MLNFCQRLPKIELHAHLNGSLSEKTLTLLNVPPLHLKGYQIINKIANTTDKLNECFKLFQIAHNATCTVDAVYKATENVIEEFFQDNVIYLELRTTPRQEQSITKRDYIETVVRAIKNNVHKINVKLILSIDRNHSLQISQEAMDLIIDMHKQYPDIIKGVDLCGNPNKGVFYENLFNQARNSGLRVTLHCGEVQNVPEVLDMLRFKPDRIGHGTCIHPQYGGSDEVWDLYCQLKIPLECCLTSNVLCGTSKSYNEHHLKKWMDNKFPFNLNTDDKGVFCTTLSEEYHYAAQHLNLNQSDLIKCSLSAIGYSFGTDLDKANAIQIIDEWKQEMCNVIYKP